MTSKTRPTSAARAREAARAQRALIAATRAGLALGQSPLHWEQTP